MALSPSAAGPLLLATSLNPNFKLFNVSTTPDIHASVPIDNITGDTGAIIVNPATVGRLVITSASQSSDGRSLL